MALIGFQHTAGKDRAERQRGDGRQGDRDGKGEAELAEETAGLVVQETIRTGGSTAEIAALIGAQCWHELKAPVARLGTEVVPMPFARSLEKAAVPDEAAIVAAVRGLVAQ